MQATLPFRRRANRAAGTRRTQKNVVTVAKQKPSLPTENAAAHLSSITSEAPSQRLTNTQQPPPPQRLAFETLIAIDPGARGAIAIGDKNCTHTLELLSDVTPRWLKAHLTDDKRRTLIVIEKAQAMPGQGVSSMFNYGVGFGRLIGWAECLEVPCRLVTPREWTKAMHRGCEGATPKERSLVAARRLFPHLNFFASHRSKKPHDGLVDAALLCEYARLTYALA